jgi:hypothetical protein
MLTKLQKELRAVERRYNELLFAFHRQHFDMEEAREFAQHGFMRRLGTLRQCVENVFTLIPPEIEDVPDRKTLHDAQINIQAFLANVYGSLDNLAWMWVYERGLKIRPNRVGFRSHHTTLRSTLSAEFQAHLEKLDGWMKYIAEYRDALAHRIPLYIPPGNVRSANADSYNELWQQMGDALYVEQDGLLYERLKAQLEQLLVFQPIITHSVRERTGYFKFHAQMLVDFMTVEEIGYKMLAELKISST